ncbi:MAG: radical SAM/SPASM domain-containing protein [Elusimicrobiota bacterium]
MKLDENALLWACMQLSPEHVPAGLVSKAAVDSGSRCGLRCPFCATGNGSLALGKEMMSKGRFADILARLPRLKLMTLHQWGEPLLNADIYEMIEAASRRGVEVIVSTSLSIPSFDANAARRLISSGLSRLIVSCDGASRRTYEQYRVGGDFDLVMRNLRTLLAAKRGLKSAGPRIDWRFLVHRGNQHEIWAAARRARALGTGFVVEKLGIPREDSPRWAPDPAVLQRVPLNQRRSPRRVWRNKPDKWTGICLQAWSMPVVRADGTVLPCCVVSDSRYALGNILREPFEKIWNKPLIVAMRRYLKAGTKSDMKLPCHGCPHDPNAPDRGQ